MMEPEQRPQEQRPPIKNHVSIQIPPGDICIESGERGGGRNDGGNAHVNGDGGDNLSLSEVEEDDDSTEHTPKSNDDRGGRNGGIGGGSSHGNGGSGSNTNNKHLIGERETNAVKCLKVTFIMLLTILAAVLSGFIYIRINGNEVNEFETDFLDRSDMIYNHVEYTMSRTLQSIHGLSIQVSTAAAAAATSAAASAAIASNDTNYDVGVDVWPFVTIPDFDLRAMTASTTNGGGGNGGGAGMILAPLVTASTRLLWEEYVKNQTSMWLPMALERSSSYSIEGSSTPTITTTILDEDGGNVSSSSKLGGIDIGIWKYGPDLSSPIIIPEHGMGPYFPIWHYSPVISSTGINYNLASDDIVKNGLLASYETHMAVLGEVVEFDKLNRTTTSYDGSTSSESSSSTVITSILQPRRDQQQNGNESYREDPISILYYPVFDTTVHGRSSGIEDESSSAPSSPSLVAILLATVKWSEFFSNILPSDDLGYVCILANECGQELTFELNGPDVVFVGPGDLHDAKYNDLGESYYLNGTLALTLSPSFPVKNVPEVQLVNDYCPYSLHVYPTQRLQEAYVSDTPILLSVCVGAVFLVTVLVFVIYDGLVERRQRLVMKFALESHAIVSSFFPATVRARLFGATGLGMLTGRRKSQINQNPMNATATASTTNESEVNDSGRDSRKTSFNPLQTIRRRSMDHNKSFDDGIPSSEPDGLPSDKGGKLDGKGGLNRNSSHQSSRDSLNRSSHHHRGNNGSQHRYDDGQTQSPKKQLQSMMGSSTPGITVLETPIADLFPNSTVFFADIAGFTAWSSQREPTQVFTLLQTLYHAFDRVANKRDVFKVETIGDCYMAVTGVPNPQADHAVRMTRFAKECMHQMNVITKGLEVRLGPDTGDLGLRVGIHSGPVTAGVLLGEKSRFQLFGDTVNTASRMESTGEKNRIQASQATANLLIEAGKGSWIIPRSGKITAKGKGEMQTYWIAGKGQPAVRKLERSNSGGLDEMTKLGSSQVSTRHLQLQVKKTPVDDEKYRRMIEWQVDLLARMLKKIKWVRLARNHGSNQKVGSMARPSNVEETPVATNNDLIVIDEVSESILFPPADSNQGLAGTHPDSIELDHSVITQLRNYVTSIAGLYRLNTFHNFEHATHVTQAIQKFLHRIENDNEKNVVVDSESAIQRLHRTELANIISDPLTSFAIVFSGLVHDVDHPGMTNEQIIKEDPRLASFYRHRSVNEQNSVDIAWGMLLEPAYSDLLRCICDDEIDRSRFRQVLVNSVIATDLFDKEMKESREARWQRAFDVNIASDATDSAELTNLKSTLIIEYLLQASDIAHTMQHWTIYQKFNQSLFEEMYNSFENGRLEVDPSRHWHKSELEFFDTIVLPLAERLAKCDVFGFAGQECLAYARANKQELVAKGDDALRDMVSKLQQRKFMSTMKKDTGRVKGGDPQRRRFSIATTQA